jgi:hypothetical protein
MDQHKVALDVLLGLLGDLPGHQPRDDISVDRIPRSGVPTLFLVTLQGAAKMHLQSLSFKSPAMQINTARACGC